jgi:hypothetical protein
MERGAEALLRTSYAFVVYTGEIGAMRMLVRETSLARLGTELRLENRRSPKYPEVARPLSSRVFLGS